MEDDVGGMMASTGFDGSQAATVMRASHASGLGGYVEREAASSSPQSLEKQMRMTFLKFRRSESELDWNYPFDFCGSIYRLSSVKEVISKIQPPTKIAKPNTFEFEGNKAIKFNMLARN